MPRIALLLLALALCLPLRAAEVAPPTTQRVYVCTHSFMEFTARMLPVIARSAGCTQVTVGEDMIGGSTCIQHWNVPDERNKTKIALGAGGIDVLTLSPFYVMPDPGIDHFTRLGLEKNPALRVFVQASWPAFDRTDSIPAQAQAARNGATVASLEALHTAQNAGWRAALEAQVATLNQDLGHEAVRIIPVNDAVFALRERLVDGKVPGLAQQTDLFKDDIGHPTPPLALLVTYCHFAAIYGRSPVGLPVPASLKDHPMAKELVAVLQEIAWQAVSTYGKETAVTK
jgi:hypothetical protein